MAFRSGAFPDSTNLDLYTFDDETKELVITFQTGRRYAYSGVPVAVVTALLEAESAGKFFAANIRNTYSYTRLEG